MEIVFNASTYEPGSKIEDLVIENYKQAIFSIYNSLKETLDLSLLNLIIVPEDYKSELFEFQRNNGHSEFITENEYGQGCAQVVSSKSNSGETIYNVVIDKKLIFSFVADNKLQAIKETFNAEQYKEFCDIRQLAINALCHEFAHVNEYSLNREIKWLQDIEIDTDLHLQYLELAKQCWSEYFACRTVSSTFPLKPEDCTEIINTCNDAEKMLQQKRSKYNRKIITLDDFVREFHKYTTFILKKIASAHGNLYCLAESRGDIIQTMEDNFGESYIKVIWSEYGRELNKLYEEYPMWKDNTVFDDVISLNEKYFNQFDIYISQTAQGIYYDIPVRL